MPLNNVTQSDRAERRHGLLSREDAGVEEIVTPIEAGAQAQAEHEFETQRKIPDNCTCAIVSVNGKDVDEVPMTSHHRAA